MYTENTQATFAILRDTSQLSWSVIPFISIVVLVFFWQADQKNWSRILAALAFLFTDLFNELWNGLVCHWSEFAPVWGIKPETNYQILIGWNIEILCGFMLVGIASTMAMPADKSVKYFGINNRLWFIGINSALSVAFEIALNKAGLIHWAWPWWNAENPWLIFLVGYVPFFTMAYLVYDAPIKRAVKILAGIITVDIIFALILASKGWI
ncbi:hypothetical protein [Bacterioplanoides sp.]|uniref:hypothetical protein n=1 Tax=Bacterioplanoides sp. TaxID=2066072 RepID=UPI003B5A4070